MKDQNHHIHVLMPDDSILDVSYYCKPGNQGNDNSVQLMIQLDDCVCSLQIERSMCKKAEMIETLVCNKVINTKGHLC